MFLDAGLSGTYRIPVYGVLVDHDEGRFLFDTGFDLEHIRNPVGWTDPAQTVEQTIPAQLYPDRISAGGDIARHQLSLSSGSLRWKRKHCKHATTVCHAFASLETLRSPAPSEEIPYSEVSFAPGLRANAAL